MNSPEDRMEPTGDDYLEQELEELEEESKWKQNAYGSLLMN